VAGIFVHAQTTEEIMASITRYRPFDELFDELSKGFFVRPFALPGEPELKMKIEVKEGDKAYTVRAEIPGVKKEDIQIDVTGGQVSISAEVKKEKEEKQGERVLHSERYYGMLSRSFTLPADVDSQTAKAEYKDGVLELTLPKKASAQSKRLTIS
jgi:HSP20 family protein